MFYCLCEGAQRLRQSPGRVNFRKVCTFSLKTWDISLTLNMTYSFILRHSERSEESHNLSEEYILRTFSVCFFACAQYDVFFAFPGGESEVGFTVFAKERSDCGKLPGGRRSTKCAPAISYSFLSTFRLSEWRLTPRL